MLYYPVLVNGVLLIAFGGSLFFPPTVVERIARLRDKDLPAAGDSVSAPRDRGVVRVLRCERCDRVVHGDRYFVRDVGALQWLDRLYIDRRDVRR